jgi:hypothetical protein
MGPDELTFTVGSKLSIIRKEPDLWKGRCDGKVGWFPPDCKLTFKNITQINNISKNGINEI